MAVAVGVGGERTGTTAAPDRERRDGSPWQQRDLKGLTAFWRCGRVHTMLTHVHPVVDSALTLM